MPYQDLILGTDADQAGGGNTKQVWESSVPQTESRPYQRGKTSGRGETVTARPLPASAVSDITQVCVVSKHTRANESQMKEQRSDYCN